MCRRILDRKERVKVLETTMTSVPMIDIELFCQTVRKKDIKLVFPSFCSIFDKRHLSRPQKGRADVQKITQLETKGLQSLKIDDDNSPNDRYGNILLPRVSIFNCLQVDFRLSV